MTADQIRAQQRLLPLPVANNVALVGIEGARNVLGLDAESISALIQDGELLWVWDFALSPVAAARRELRFWRLDLIAAASRRQGKAEVIGTRDLLLPVVLDTILPPTKAAFNSWELQALLTISGQQLQRLCDVKHLSGEVRGHTRWITRSSLVAFLSKRLVGH
jgi:hypothetical protein